MHVFLHACVYSNVHVYIWSSTSQGMGVPRIPMWRRANIDRTKRRCCSSVFALCFYPCPKGGRGLLFRRSNSSSYIRQDVGEIHGVALQDLRIKRIYRYVHVSMDTLTYLWIRWRIYRYVHVSKTTISDTPICTYPKPLFWIRPYLWIALPLKFTRICSPLPRIGKWNPRIYRYVDVSIDTSTYL